MYLPLFFLLDFVSDEILLYYFLYVISYFLCVAIEIIILILCVITLLLPLVFWSYIFTTFFVSGITKLQFLLWIAVGALASIPLVFHDAFFLWDILWNIFLALWNSWLFSLVINFFIMFSGIFFVYFLGGYLFQQNKRNFWFSYLISILAIFLFILLLSVSALILQYIFPYKTNGVTLWYGGIVSFFSIWGIIGYYIVISLLEEGNKYISGLSFSGRWDYFQVLGKYISMSACIALGFAFFENILYSYSYFQSSWISFGLLKLVFFRSVFTIILHLVCSILFALGFWYILHISKISIRKLTWFLAFTLLATVSHVVFDSLLSFGYLWVIFVYVGFIYLLISYLFVRLEQ